MSISYPSIVIGGLTSNTGSFSGSFLGYLSGSSLVTELTASTGISSSVYILQDGFELSSSSQLGGGGISTVYTSGNITGSGELINPVSLKNDITLNSLTASYISASSLLLANNPYITTSSLSATLTSSLVEYARLSSSNHFFGSNTFDSNTIVDLLSAHNTVIVDGQNNSNYAYLFLQGTTESHLRIRHGYTEVGDFYNSGDDLVIKAYNSLQITGSTTLSGNLGLSGSNINGNPKISITGSTQVVDQIGLSLRTAKYTALVETTTGNYHVQSCDLLLANNGITALITPYAFTCTSGSYLASFDVQINGGLLEVVINKLVSQNLSVTMTKTYLY